jgi:non-specific serine/threonine protein kinase
MPVVQTEPRAGSRPQSVAGRLPVELSSFVGRSVELSEIRRLLQAAHAITLTGPGGIGKTRLAVRAARKLARHFPDGVAFIELADVEGPDQVPYALARSLRVQERRGEAIKDAVIAHLGEQRVLLVLDNCEHVVDACRRLVASVVSRCERVRVLATSRERLDVPGEAVVALSALEFPPDGQALGIAEVDAVRLLVDRAVAVAPGFALTDENTSAACEICRRLDGLPLAIELAAVRLASMTADDLRERLDDRLRLLAAAPGVGPGRSHTLRATVDWSYELLSEDERMLWRRLSVFAGSFGLEAAEQICSGAGLERERIVDLVGSLVSKSILTMARGGRRGRYRLLETLRLYGAQRLAESGEGSELAHEHAAWLRRARFGRGPPVVGASGAARRLRDARRGVGERRDGARLLRRIGVRGRDGTPHGVRSVALLARERALPGRHQPSRGAPRDRAVTHTHTCDGPVGAGVPRPGDRRPCASPRARGARGGTARL